jgi:hypothetical protein
MKLRKRLLTLLCLLLIGNAHAVHPLKMSVADMVYKDKKMHLKFKVFADDFGVELSLFCNKPVTFTSQTPSAEVQSCLQTYMKQNFACLVNGNELTFHLKTTKVEEGNSGIIVVWLEYESLPFSVTSFKTIKVRDSLLFRFKGEQKNMVNIDLFSGENIQTLQFDNRDGPVMKEIVF